jgi:hypothetical protein
MATTLSADGASGNNSPNDAATAESRRFAVRRLRGAALIGLVAPSVEYGMWILHGTRHLHTVAQERESDPELYSEVVSTFTTLLIEQGAELIAWAIAGLWLAYPVFYGICFAVHRWVLRRVSESEWWVASNTALWPLPYAATCGVITWFAYWHLSRMAGRMTLLAESSLIYWAHCATSPCSWHGSRWPAVRLRHHSAKSGKGGHL